MKAKAAAFEIIGLQEIKDHQEATKLALAMGEVGQFEEHRRFQFEFIKSRGLGPSDRVLEIGFGPLTLGIPLIQHLDPAHYTGVDVREDVSDLAYQQIGKHHLSAKNPRLIVSNDFGMSMIGEERFDIIWSFSVLFHLTDELVDELFQMVSSTLTGDGRFVALINTSQDEGTWLEFPFLKRGPDFYRDLASRRKLSMKLLGAVSEFGFRLPGPDAEHVLLEFTRA